MPEESPVLSPVRLIELRLFASWAPSYLQRILDTTYVPNAEGWQGIVREIQNAALALSGESLRQE